MSTSIEPSESFQIPIEAAERYESAFVPAFFAQWAPLLCDAAGISPGQSVLDVACGTGIVARTAAGRVAPDGKVIGLDLNDAMLSVARRVRPDIDWRRGDVEDLPFPDESFDAVLCQMALMFFADRTRALREMARVASVGGTVAVVVPSRLEHQIAFAPFVAMAVSHAGPDAAALLSTYFVCGDIDQLTHTMASTGLQPLTIQVRSGTYHAPTVDAFVTTEVESTPMRERISDEVYRRIRREAVDVLAPYVAGDGSVAVPFDCNIVTARPTPVDRTVQT